MSKRQKLSFFPLEDLPNEILLKILSLLDIKGVLQCGQSSKRLREISNDKSLWLKLNLTGRKIPYGYIEKAMQNGCEYLNTRWGSIRGGKKSEVPWKLKYLELSQFQLTGVPKGVLQNCHSLEKLAVENIIMKSHDIEQICQNGETLRILSFGPTELGPKLIEKLFTKCHQLTEVNMYFGFGMSDPQVCALVNNLTPNILKLNLGIKKVKDEHVNTLLRRCNKITELNLSETSITNDSVKSIVEHSNFLEKLHLSYNNIDFTTLLQLKSIPTLKILHCYDCIDTLDPEKIKKLKLQLPHISINQPEDSLLQIASPTKKVIGSIDEVISIDKDWFWEIRANQQDLFPRAR